jgi:membrane protein implicated in regulation of membrane protease activity
MWWLVWELCKYLAVYAATGLLILALPGEPPRWLQFTLFLLVALSLTIVIYRVRVSRGRKDS